MVSGYGSDVAVVSGMPQWNNPDMIICDRLTKSRSLSIRLPLFALPLLVAALAPWLAAQKTATYYPAPGQWQKKSPAELGMDAAKLQQAIEYAQAHGSTWNFEKDQIRTFGAILGPLPKQRAATNGIILRHGYIV